MKCLVLGDGLLGKEIVSQSGYDFLSRKKDMFEVTNINLNNYHESMNDYDVIINCNMETCLFSNKLIKLKNYIDISEGTSTPNFSGGLCMKVAFIKKDNISVTGVEIAFVCIKPHPMPV